jgi:hypothetical protein
VRRVDSLVVPVWGQEQQNFQQASQERQEQLVVARGLFARVEVTRDLEQEAEKQGPRVRLLELSLFRRQRVPYE